jgi:hypothetical protein
MTQHVYPAYTSSFECNPTLAAIGVHWMSNIQLSFQLGVSMNHPKIVNDYTPILDRC